MALVEGQPHSRVLVAFECFDEHVTSFGRGRVGAAEAFLRPLAAQILKGRVPPAVLGLEKQLAFGDGSGG